MLALADVLLVTGDSANMMGEAAATGAGAHLYRPVGRASKLDRLADALIAEGAARPWRGVWENFRVDPRDDTAAIARRVAEAWRRKATASR
jgi:hypothetical protein